MRPPMEKAKRPKTLRPMAEESILERIDDATEAAESAFHRDFRRALRGAIRATDLSSLEVAIRYGDENLADKAFDWSRMESNLAEALTGDTATSRELVAAADTGVEIAERIAVGVGLEVPASLTEEALDAARKRVGRAGLQRAKDLTDESRRGVRKLIREAFQPNRSRFRRQAGAPS